jgi:hypothetical protein
MAICETMRDAETPHAIAGIDANGAGAPVQNRGGVKFVTGCIAAIRDAGTPSSEACQEE